MTWPEGRAVAVQLPSLSSSSDSKGGANDSAPWPWRTVRQRDPTTATRRDGRSGDGGAGTTDPGQ